MVIIGTPKSATATKVLLCGSEELGIPTSPYRFAGTEEEFIEAVKTIGMPCVVKPIMSSSGHGQSVVRKAEDIDPAWQYAQEGGRAGAGASRAVVVNGDSNQLSLGNLDKVLAQPDTQMRFFGKPEVHGHRRMAVLLARGLDVADARRKTGIMMDRLEINL